MKEEDIKKETREETLAKMLVAPHEKISRDVTEKDISKITEGTKVLYELCFVPIGYYKGAYAMHHSQIDDKDPMNFFVTHERKIIINPKITRHSNYTVDSKEACRTFSDQPQVIVPRWQKIEVEYVTVMIDPEDKEKFKLSGVIKESLSGFEAFVMQHEFDHGQAKYIYPYNKK